MYFLAYVYVLRLERDYCLLFLLLLLREVSMYVWADVLSYVMKFAFKQVFKPFIKMFVYILVCS